ncbi:slipin family protein [Paenibacillus athensensis]|uniref:Peptidase n=1 Tax=Paenibacillus athensensis TaxID=1967502 RepID=A0A4Y8PX63_9BACL|nr:slipin family protein [Paenibacillus athensensis]MCD1258029.1 slipin family protein [Paenibacillus athensensis]
MWKTINIQNDERGLLFRDGRYVKLLAPGRQRYLPLRGESVELLNVLRPFSVPGKDLRLFLGDDRLRMELSVVEVADDEYALHFEDGQFVSVLATGRHAFWHALKRHEIVRADKRDPLLPAGISATVAVKLVALGVVQAVDVGSHEVGLLFFNHVLHKQLGPGRYFFWRGPVSVTVRNIDLRQQQQDVTGQEMMTMDKIALRLNFVCQYKIIDPLKSLEIKALEEQIYVRLQLQLREYVGTLKLDELLNMRQEIAAFVLTRLNAESATYGVQFISAGVKDVILPGDVKEILNTVLLAEKKAQANLITRREETASTRSLLNTAKLMEENQTLYRLKELEFLEKICEKIGSVSVGGGGSLLEQLNFFLADKSRGV